MILATQPDGRATLGGALVSRRILIPRFVAKLLPPPELPRLADSAAPPAPQEAPRYPILIGHGDARDAAQSLEQQLETILPRGSLEFTHVTDTGTALSVHGGPGTLIVGIQRTRSESSATAPNGPSELQEGSASDDTLLVALRRAEVVAIATPFTLSITRFATCVITSFQGPYPSARSDAVSIQSHSSTGSCALASPSVHSLAHGASGRSSRRGIRMTRILNIPLLTLAGLLAAVLPAPPALAQSAPLSISGTPSTTAIAASSYSFSPTAAGGRSTRRFFGIRGKPNWASFNWRTGTLSGTPAAGQLGTYANIRISVSDGRSSASLPAFSIAVVTSASTPAPITTANRPPVISGTPATRAIAGSPYAFQPSASDPDGDTLTFTIQSKPAWASFSPTTGRLSGTPASTDVGTTSGIAILASDGRTVSSLPAFAIEVTAPTATSTNRPPTLVGTPPTSVVAGQPYAFQPTGVDPDGDVVAYGISNRPAWATFSSTTGRLSGIPSASDVGTTSNIVIAVSDTQASAALPAFSITVTQSAIGSLTLDWTAPTTNTDGTPLTDLAGYQIQYGTTPTALTQSIRVPNSGVTTYVVNNLSPGTWYFALSAYNTAGVSSAPSAPVSASVP